ncbi:MSH2 protein [Coemansia erecta]|nr:MSH2 protein [Coemansia erecta]
MAAAPVVMGVAFKAAADQMHVGVAFVDPAQRSIGVCEFEDTDVFSNIESLVIQLGVRECLVEPESTMKQLDHRRLVDVLQRCGVVVTECLRAQFSAADIVQDLGRLVAAAAPVASLPELDLKLAMGALAAAIRYLNLLSDESNFGGFSIATHGLSQYMKLDASAVQALNLLPSTLDGASKTMSLLGLLNHCKTAQGQRLLAQWLKQPLLSVPDIEDRLDLVDLFFNDVEARTMLRSSHLRNMPDFKRLATRFQRHVASLQDVVRVYQAVVALPTLVDVLAACAGGSSRTGALLATYYLNDLSQLSAKLHGLQQMVEAKVDLEIAADAHEFYLRSDNDEGLRELYASMEREQHRVDEEFANTSRALSLDAHKKLKLERHTTFGHCMRVSRADGARLRSGKYFELATQKTGVFFTTPAMREASRAYRECSDAYARAQAALVKQLIGDVAQYSGELELLNKRVAHLDCVLSFAEASACAPIPYTRPTVCSDGDFKLTGARHPCLEVQDGVSFIANDVDLSRGRSDFAIITGPNMGGKSTYIRQTGVIALMAQIGCFVPCDSAQIGIVDCILARVGAGDAQLKGVSTFMAEMLETASILKTATSRSLVIIDELGRGTSTYDGFGLAWAISEHIITEIKCKCLFATHFHELTEIEARFPNVDNLHVMATIGAQHQRRELTLLYKIGKGVCDQSFGIHVAELANFPDSVVRLARRKVEELEDFGGKCADRGAENAMDVDGAEFSKDEMASGSRTIELFLAEFTATPGLAELPPQSVAERVNELRAKYESEISANRWVQNVISTL